MVVEQRGNLLVYKEVEVEVSGTSWSLNFSRIGDDVTETTRLSHERG